MGTVEKKVKEKAKKEKIQKIILGSIKVGGLISVALVAPNILKSLETLGIISLDDGRKNTRINRSLKALLKNKEVKFVVKNNKKYLILTRAGELKLKKWALQDFIIIKPKKWDKKWRIIAFDISEKRKKERDLIRLTLSRIGFIKLQNSVWVYPYDCEEFITLLKTDFQLGKTLLYIVADEIEWDKPLRSHFDLK